MIDKKKLFKSLIIISLLIIIIVAVIQTRKTLARYESTADTVRDVDVAFWVVDNSFQTQRLLIEDIYPSETPYQYTFTVSNFKDSKRAETDIGYNMVITTTTNLPLSFTFKKNGSTYAPAEDLYQDEDGTYYREFRIASENNQFVFQEGANATDTYILNVTFPIEYNTNLEYADLMENIQIDLSAKQIIGE